MKYSIPVKLIAIVLAVVCLLATLVSALGIVVLIDRNLNDWSFQESMDNHHYFDRRQLADDLLRRYGSLILGDYPQECFEAYVAKVRIYDVGIKDGFYDYTIFDTSGQAVVSTYDESQVYASTWAIEREMVSYRTTHYPANVVPSVETYYDELQQRYVDVKYVSQHLEDYTVRLYLKADAYVMTPEWQVVAFFYGLGYWLFAAFCVSLLAFVAAMIYLCQAAGRVPNSDEVNPRGLSRLPLDIYTAFCAAVGIGGVWFALRLTQLVINQAPQLLIFLTGLDLTLVGLALVGYIMAWAAQIKMKHRYWLKNTLIGRIFRLIFAGLRWLNRCVNKLFRLLPMIWRWFATMALMVILPIACLLFINNCHYRWEHSFWALIFYGCLLLDLLIVLYVPVCFGILYRGVKKMRQGDLTAKISTRFLFGSFRQFALDLNNLSDTIAVAVRQQMRSERMKAELITNVSHDIKTPLTSIINFVDLLQKPHTEEQQQEYLAVLARQSAQMKKLIGDLTELSKATTGNIAVVAQRMDAVEAVNQALGEFSGKLDTADLTPVFRQPEEPIYISADGRLVWRVLSNLLENAAKYALPGTRLYVDLRKNEGCAILSLKNISREPLTVTADELLERFVQGDASRNTEGSGLGLNIAKGLMESQQGALELQLDGDLFKVILTFPLAQ